MWEVGLTPFEFAVRGVVFVNVFDHDLLLSAINRIKNTILPAMQTMFHVSVHFFVIELIGILDKPLNFFFDVSRDARILARNFDDLAMRELLKVEAKHYATPNFRSSSHTT